MCCIWWDRVVFLAQLLWRHNGHDGVSNHQPHECLLNRSFMCRSKKTSKLHVTGLCAGNSPVTRKMLPFDDVIMHSIQQDLNKMADILRMVFVNAFSWMEICVLYHQNFNEVQPLGSNCHNILHSIFNSLWPCGTTWWYWSGSTLVMMLR